MSDDFNEQDVKARLMRVMPALVGTHHIEALLADPKFGIVTFDAMAPSGVREFDHWLNFPKAIHTVLAFCGTDTRNEWVVLGRSALVMMRNNPDFEQCEPIECGQLIYVGKHKTISVYTQSTDTPHPIAGNAFVAGIRGKSARGLIHHGPIHEPVPPNVGVPIDDEDDGERVGMMPEPCYEDEEMDPPKRSRRKVPEDFFVDEDLE